MAKTKPPTDDTQEIKPAVLPTVDEGLLESSAPIVFYDVSVSPESRFNPVRSAGNLFFRETPTRIRADDPNLAEYIGNSWLTVVAVQEEVQTEA